MPTQTVSNATTTQGAGYYAAFNLATVDADLVATNIVSGATIFGITGSAVAAMGTATAADVLSGTTFSNSIATGIAGTMPTRTLNAASTIVSAGYYNATTLNVVDADLATGNIRSGATIFGVAGNVIQASGAAAPADVRSGVSFSNTSGAQTGTMPTQTLSAASTTVSAGYYIATMLNAVDGDLATGNIRSGVNIFGVNGDPNVVNTSSGDAVAAQIGLDKKAWVDGSEITGTAFTKACTGTLSAGRRLGKP